MLSHAELAVHRWDTYTPTLPAQVTETFLSAQPSPWTTDPVVPIQNLSIIGIPSQIATATVGTFSARVRNSSATNRITAAGQSGSYWSAYVGDLVRDTTANAVFWVERDLGSATAQITEPVTPYVDAVTAVNSLPIPYVAIASGDSLSIDSLPEINCARSPQGIVFNAGVFHVQCAPFSFSPVSGTPFGSGSLSIAESRLSGYVTGVDAAFIVNSFVDSSSFYDANAQVFAGALDGHFPTLESGSLLTGDVLVDSGTGAHALGRITIARAYLSAPGIDSDGGSVVSIGTYDGPVWYPDNSLWGPAGFDLHDGATLVCEQSCATQLLLAGTLSMHGSTTAFPWSSSTRTWSAAATITPAAIDAAGAMCDPATGDCFRH